MIIHNFEQVSPEWFAIRKGKMTASHAQAIGNAGKGLLTYINSLMAEFYSSGKPDQFISIDIKRGNELESQARSIYELKKGITVQQVGFIEADEFSGCSPDGLISEDGGIEIKCPNDEVYFQYLLEGAEAIDTKYIWQIQMSLLISDRKYFDFIAYNPNFKETIFIHRVERDTEKLEKLKIGLAKGAEMIKEIKSKMK